MLSLVVLNIVMLSVVAQTLIIPKVAAELELELELLFNNLAPIFNYHIVSDNKIPYLIKLSTFVITMLSFVIDVPLSNLQLDGQGH